MRVLKTLHTVMLLLALLAVSIDVSASEPDHDDIKHLRDAGVLLPLEEVLHRAEARLPGKVVETELEEDDGGYVYEIKVLGSDGVLREIVLDAGTGEVVSVGAKPYR